MDEKLADLLEEVEKINNNNPITVFEMLSACFFYKGRPSKNTPCYDYSQASQLS